MQKEKLVSDLKNVKFSCDERDLIPDQPFVFAAFRVTQESPTLQNQLDHKCSAFRSGFRVSVRVT